MSNKSIKSLIHEAETKWSMWIEISESEEFLTDRGKTKQEALMLANFFEGKFDGLCLARDLSIENQFIAGRR